MKAYTALENAEVPGFRELALYDEARLLHEKGDEDGAKSRLKKVVDKLAKEKEPLAMNPMGPGDRASYLAERSKALLMRIDPKGDACAVGRRGASAGARRVPEEDASRG